MSIQPGDSARFSRILTQEDFNRFADLSGDDNPIHCDPEFAAKSHFGGTVSHGMLLYSLICKALSEHIPGPGAVQLEQELMFPNGTYTGEEIKVCLDVKAIQPDGSVELDTYVVKATDDTHFKATGRARVLPKGLPLPAAPAPSTSDAGETDPELYGLKPGMYVEKTRIFTPADLSEYGNLGGDRNPIFREADYARECGFTDTPVPWPLLAGMFSDMLGTDLPGRGTGWMKQKLVYLNPAYPGEAITARVQITRLRADKELVNLKSTLTGADGRLICDGESLVLVRNLADKGDKTGRFKLA
jgi:acyl dehydratase